MIELKWAEVSNTLDAIIAWVEHHDIETDDDWASKRQMLADLSKAAEDMEILWDDLAKLKEENEIARELLRESLRSMDAEFEEKCLNFLGDTES